MKLDEAIRDGIDSNDPAWLRGVVDFMRFRLGWTAAQCLGAAKKSVPGLTDEVWEQYMRRLDDYEALTLR